MRDSLPWQQRTAKLRHIMRCKCDDESIEVSRKNYGWKDLEAIPDQNLGTFPKIPLHPSPDFCGPPARAYQQEAPIRKEFRRLAFEGVADKLEDPPHDEQSDGNRPVAVDEDGDDEKDEG